MSYDEKFNIYINCIGIFSFQWAKVVTYFGRRVSGLNESEMVADFAWHRPMVFGIAIITRIVLVINPGKSKCRIASHVTTTIPCVSC